jgi:protein-L-isoaspartate(D-aspartate) O-methyltransferase
MRQNRYRSRPCLGGAWVVMLCFLLPCCTAAGPPSAPATSTSLAPSPTYTPADPYLEARLAMVRDQIEKRGVSDPAVLEAMRVVPRHLFVPQEWTGDAYADHPLPIGYGQTISQPYIVAWMTELLQGKPGDRVLEIGTGSGYQAAVLAELGYEVYTIEIVEPLAGQASARLEEMGYENVTTKRGDGYFGWPEQAPFQAIMVTCAPDHIPPPLVEQLAEGGRMVVPVGPPGGYQSLFLITKENGAVKSENLGGVRFVPLTR